MTTRPVTVKGGWSGFQIADSDAAANTATTELISILDTLEAPIVVVRRDCRIACFNKVAADVLGLSQQDIGRPSRDVSVLAGFPRLEQQCSQVIASGLESRIDFRHGDKWFLVRISPYSHGDRQVTGTVLTFGDVTAFRASIAQAIYERECTRAIINTFAHPLVVLSDDQRIQSGNRAFYTMFGVSRDDTQGVPLYDLRSGVFEGVPLRERLQDMLAGSHPFQPIEVEHVLTAEGQRTLILDAHPLPLPGHSERRVLVTFQDITERRAAEAAKDLRAEHELRRREAKIQRLVETNVVGIIMWNLEGVIAGANEAFLHMLQYDREDLTSGRLRWTDLTPAEWHDRDERAIAELKASGVFQPYEKEYLRKDGSRVPILLGGALSEGSGNEGVAFILDLSEQKRADRALRRSEQRWRSVFENSAIGVALSDLNGRFIATNPVFQKMLGYTEEELQNLTFLDITLEEFRDRNWSLIDDLLARKVQQFQIEKQYRRKDGSLVWVHNSISMVPGTERVPQFLMALSEDITERKRAEMALHAAMEERARLAAFRAEIGMALSRQEDLRGILHACANAMVRHLDAAFARIWTLSSDSRELELQASAGKYTRLDGSHSRIQVGQLKIGLIAQERKPHFTNDVQNDPRVTDKDWARRENMMSFAGYPLILEDRLVGVIGMFAQKPLTENTLEALSFGASVIAQGIERKRAEDELRSSEESHRLIVETANDAVVSMDESGAIRFANASAMKIFGYDPATLIGKPLTMLMPEYMRKLHESGFRSYLATGQRHINWQGTELAGLRKNGEEFAVEVSFGELTRNGHKVFTGFIRDVSEKKRAEEALRTSEQELRVIVDTIPGMVCMLKADWEVEFVNQPLREYFGMTLEELKNWEFIGVVHPDDIERVVAKTSHSSATGEPYDVEHRCLRHDGVFRWFQVRAMPLRDASGHLVRWYLLLTDIEDRKRAEEALCNSERNLSLIINTMPVLAWSARPDGSAEFLSQRWLEYTGFSAEQARDWGWTAAIHRDDAQGLLKIWQSSLVSGAPLEAEARMRRFDGAYRWLLFRTSVLRDESGNIVKWYGTAADIEDRKQAEQQLRRNEWNLLEAQRLGRSGSWSLDVSSGIVTTTPEILRTYGVRPGEVTSNPDFWFSRIHHEDRKWVRELFEKCLAEKTEYDAVYRVLRPDGSISHQHSIGRPIVNDSGDLVEFMGAAIDITEQVEARNALLKGFAAIEKSEDQLRAIISTIPALVWSASPDGSAEFFNQRWLDYTGLSAEQAKDWGWTAAIHPGDLERLTDYWKSVIVAGEPMEIEGRIRRIDGDYRWFLFRSDPLRSESGNIVKWYGTSTDIDDRKRAEGQLRRSEESLRLQVGVLQNMPGSAWTVLPDGTPDFASQQWLDYAGQTLDYVRSSPEAWMQVLHPDDRESAAATYWQGVRSGEGFAMEARFLRVSDGVYRWHFNRAVPLRDSVGNLIKLIGTSIDIEDLKRAERELRQLIDFLPQHVVVLDKGGTLLQANKTMLDYMGLTLDEMKGGETPERLIRDVHPEDLERLEKERSAGLSKGRPFEIDRRLLGKDGRYRWFLFRYNPLLNEAGDIVRWFATATDVEDRKQAEDRMRNETVALREQIDRESMFEDIVGSSEALGKVLRQVAGVARTDSTVLICGETGTGKELIARAIHKRSLRSDQAFVSVNCASIPPSLIASELFGHEKGAFTGALQQRRGRFELAHGGTIFLDEIGELPAETQIALLRVLQERQFERVGGSKIISVDVRVITATNRDLSAAIAAGTFRADLFYRLNVFPIQVPPLRLRRDDIPMLVEYFVKRFAEKMGKQINRIDKNTMDLCQKYPWPGNIRELQNIVERSVILCGGNTFSIDEAWLPVSTAPGVSVTRPMGETLQDHEREIIEAALAESKGRVAGPNGAAVKLGIPRSTLDRKIQQLRIKKRQFSPER